MERIVRERLTAAQKGDAALWKSHISSQCVWTGPGLDLVDTKDVEREIEASTALPPRPADEVRDFIVKLFGDAAIATYISIERRADGKIAKQFRKTDTYLNQKNGWELVCAVESYVAPREIVKVDPQVYDKYAGQYELDPKHTVKIWRDGTKLLSQAPDENEFTELFPVGQDTFFVDSQPGDYIFQRDQDGKVTQLIFRMGGSDLVARKTK